MMMMMVMMMMMMMMMMMIPLKLMPMMTEMTLRMTLTLPSAPSQQDISQQDWRSTKTLLQDRRCTYGVLSWSLFMRGLVFDFRSSLFHPASSSETRELISGVLAQGLATLTAKYISISPSRVRLGQYVSDIALILTTALMLSRILKADPSRSLESGEVEGSRTMLYRGVTPVSNSPFDAGLRPHDLSHQAATVNLQHVDQNCRALLVLLALLLAPSPVIVWHLKTESHSPQSADHCPLDSTEGAIVNINIAQVRLGVGTRSTAA
jgi:hypothetical protein